jgi:hypothetical protein
MAWALAEPPGNPLRAEMEAVGRRTGSFRGTLPDHR